jgi:hypothetical protein
MEDFKTNGIAPEAGMTLKLTPGIRRWLEFIAGDSERGRMVVQVTASGGRAFPQLQALRNAGYVEYYDPPEGGPDRIRITTAGRTALTHQAAMRYRRDDDRYLVYLGDDRIGFIRYSPANRRWNAADTTMSYARWFDTRDATGKALHRRFTKMTREGRLSRRYFAAGLTCVRPFLTLVIRSRSLDFSTTRASLM